MVIEKANEKTIIMVMMKTVAIERTILKNINIDYGTQYESNESGVTVVTITTNMILTDKTRFLKIIILMLTAIKKITCLMTSKTKSDIRCSIIKPFK